MASFQYKARIAASNFEPIGVEITREGSALPSIGVEVTVNVRDKDTKEVIVTDGVAAPSTTVGRWEYTFTPEEVELITANSTWLVEWKIRVGSFVHVNSELGVLPVRKRL